MELLFQLGVIVAVTVLLAVVSLFFYWVFLQTVEDIGWAFERGRHRFRVDIMHQGGQGR